MFESRCSKTAETDSRHELRRRLRARKPHPGICRKQALRVRASVCVTRLMSQWGHTLKSPRAAFWCARSDSVYTSTSPMVSRMTASQSVRAACRQRRSDRLTETSHDVSS